ncbi:manganese efflux pump MntP [Enterobacteriaceae bacterium LUAb1]
MTFFTMLILALGMSMDAFAVTIGKGAALHRPTVQEALRTGIIFGCIEAITPLIGWAIGIAASQFIMRWDHWVAFSLLLVLGSRMIWQGCRKDTGSLQEPRCRHGFWSLATTAVATSLDALAIGVGLAFLQVNIVMTALMIGVTTTIMAAAGILLGRFLSETSGKWAEVLGGLVLIVIGSTILFEHLSLSVP